MYHFNPQEDIQTKYIVFAGPGGSGKTSAACAAAVSLADHGHRTLFIGTDAVSHLSELFDMQLTAPTATVPQIPSWTSWRLIRCRILSMYFYNWSSF